jgi:hypothetical protein
MVKIGCVVRVLDFDLDRQREVPFGFGPIPVLVNMDEMPCCGVETWLEGVRGGGRVTHSLVILDGGYLYDTGDGAREETFAISFPSRDDGNGRFGRTFKLETIDALEILPSIDADWDGSFEEVIFSFHFAAVELYVLLSTNEICAWDGAGSPSVFETTVGLLLQERKDILELYPLSDLESNLSSRF